MNQDETETARAPSPPGILPPATDTPSVIPETGLKTGKLYSGEQPKPARADYGWLSQLMAAWIENLDKRYPASLRADGIEGKVTLSALLHQDGMLTDVRVVKSSGHQVLDEIAVDDVRKGPPVTLSHPLDRTHMSIKFSITYDLQTPQ